MSLYVEMPKVETKFEFRTLLAEYGKIKAEMEAKETRIREIEYALDEFAEKGLKAIRKESEVKA